MRGRPPKPTALRLVEGNPGKRPINKAEPKPGRQLPRCPKWLPKAAKAVWRDLAPRLHRIGVLTEVDGRTLAVFCVTYTRWRAAEEYLAKHDHTYEVYNDEGELKYIGQRPEVSIAKNLAVLVRGYAQELGLTPSARSRIQLPKPDDDSDDIPAELRDDEPANSG